MYNGLFDEKYINNFDRTEIKDRFAKCSNVALVSNNEIYTPMKMVKAMLDPYIDYLKTKRILLPCDAD